MTEYVFVKPSPGGRIRMPERNMIPMPAEGALVPRIDYYERLLIGGDVVITDPPASPAPEPMPAPPETSPAPSRSSKEK